MNVPALIASGAYGRLDTKTRHGVTPVVVWTAALHYFLHHRISLQIGELSEKRSACKSLQPAEEVGGQGRGPLVEFNITWTHAVQLQ